MTTPAAQRVADANDRIARAERRLSDILAELDVRDRADKTFVSAGVRSALDDLEAAREALRLLDDPPAV